ncbi:MAG TPA: RHS repeat-associated core domain-containing protein, partial [Polyangiaceae bacterium]|nr:RHS repeat-associated core domain-containing protein [Polyangiaceae bacterium]
EWDEDDFGNVVRESKWGEVVAGNKLAGGDEAITLRTLANNRQDWILGRLATEELQDAGGRRVRMKRFYYDGPAFQGLPLGEVARGDLTRQEEWVGPDPNAFELDMATQYDADGHPVETTDARGGGHRFQWDPADRTTLLGESARLEWGLLVEQFDTDRAFGNVTSATGCDSQTTVYQYDPFGRLTAVIRPGDSSSTPTVRYQYVVTPPLSRVISERRVATDSDPDERSEDLVDGLGRKRGTLTRDESSRWVFAGVSVLDSRGQGRRALRAHFATKAEHDTPPLHADAPGVDSWHDALARTIRTRTQLGIETRTALAPFEKRIWDGAQNDPTSPYEHTPTVSEQDGLGRLVRTTYTLGGRPYAATYVYDATGALVSKTDAEGNVSRYLYDGRGRRTLVKDPDAGMHMFVYDATGNLVEHHYPDGSVGRFAFDLGGRPISEDWDGDGTPEVLHTWDRSDRHPSDPLYLGKLVTMKDPSGLLENEYDSRQRVIAQHVTLDGHTYVVASAYDDQNREVLHTYPDQSSLRIHFNPRGQVAAYGQAVRFTYDGSGVESQRDFSTGVTERRAYDADLRRIESRVSSPAGSLLQDLRWTYDGAGNLTSVQDARPRVDPVHDRSEKYAFDNFYRLHTATGPWGSAAWTYSPSGNLVSRTSSVAALNSGILTYGAGSHALTAIAGRVVGYDARGRITSDGDRTYTWNGDDQLLHVQSATGASVDSVFDGGGERRRRIERSANGQSRTTYFIDPWCEVRDGKLVRFIVHGGKRIAELSGETGAGAGTAGLLTTFDPQRGRDAKARLVAMGRNAPTTLVGIALLLALAIQGWNRADRKTRMLAPAACALSLLSLAACGQGTSESSALGRTIQTLSDSDTLLFDDAIGSLTEQTSGTGTLQAEFAVYPYGVTRFDSSIETRKYANSPRDSSVGLDQMGARAYAADLGVWTSADPIAVEDPARAIGSAHGAVNPYGYAGQTPTVATDEHGHWWQIALGVAVGAAVGGAAEALRQYSESGHITDWGRVANHAAVGAAAVGVASILPTPATIAESISLAAAEGAAIGTANRLLDSGGKSAGTVGDVVVDAAIGAATGGIYSGGSKLVRNAAIASVRRSTANGVLERVGPLQGREASRIEAKLSRDGFSGVPANDGVGRVWTKPGSDGNTASVRIDPAKVRTPPKGWADEVPHAHKETVASSKVFNGNYDRPDVRYDDQCNVSEDMRAVHIEIKW